jgi:hypothetical protein
MLERSLSTAAATDDGNNKASCTVRANANCQKADLRNGSQGYTKLPVATVADCCRACGAHPQCGAFTVVTAGRAGPPVPGKYIGACYLKRNCSGLSPDPAGISGMKGGQPFPVRRPPGRLSAALSVFLCKPVFYGAFVWARRALKHQKRRFPARAVREPDVHELCRGHVPEHVRGVRQPGRLPLVRLGRRGRVLREQDRVPPTSLKVKFTGLTQTLQVDPAV